MKKILFAISSVALGCLLLITSSEVWGGGGGPQFASPIPIRSRGLDNNNRFGTDNFATHLSFFKHPAFGPQPGVNFATKEVTIAGSKFTIDDLVAVPGLPGDDRLVFWDNEMLDPYTPGRLQGTSLKPLHGFCPGLMELNGQLIATLDCQAGGIDIQNRPVGMSRGAQLQVADIRDADAQAEQPNLVADQAITTVIGSSQEFLLPYTRENYPYTLYNEPDTGCDNKKWQRCKVFTYDIADLGSGSTTGVVTAAYDIIALKVQTDDGNVKNAAEMTFFSPLAFFRKDATGSRMRLAGYSSPYALIDRWPYEKLGPLEASANQNRYPFNRLGRYLPQSINPIAVVNLTPRIAQVAPKQQLPPEVFAAVSQDTIFDLDSWAALEGVPLVDVHIKPHKWDEYLLYKDGNGAYQPLSGKMPHHIFSYVDFWKSSGLSQWGQVLDDDINPNAVFRPYAASFVGPGMFDAVAATDGAKKYLIVPSGEKAKKDGKYYIYKIDPTGADHVYLRYPYYADDKKTLNTPIELPIIIPQSYPIEAPAGFAPYNVLARDLNGDGCSDLVMTFRGELTYWLGDNDPQNLGFKNEDGQHVRFSGPKNEMFSDKVHVYYANKNDCVFDDPKPGIVLTLPIANPDADAAKRPAPQIAAIAIEDVDADKDHLPELIVGDLISRKITDQNDRDNGKYTAFAYLYHFDASGKITEILQNINPLEIRVGWSVSQSMIKSPQDLIDLAIDAPNLNQNVVPPTFGVGALALDRQLNGSHIGAINGMPLSLPPMGCATNLNSDVFSPMESMLTGSYPLRCKDRTLCVPGPIAPNKPPLPFFQDDANGCCLNPCKDACLDVMFRVDKDLCVKVCPNIACPRASNDQPADEPAREVRVASQEPDRVYTTKGDWIADSKDMIPVVEEIFFVDTRFLERFKPIVEIIDRFPRGQVMPKPREMTVTINQQVVCGDGVKQGLEECDGADKNACVVPKTECVPAGELDECTCSCPAKQCQGVQKLNPECECHCPDMGVAGCAAPKWVDPADVNCECKCDILGKGDPNNNAKAAWDACDPNQNGGKLNRVWASDTCECKCDARAEDGCKGGNKAWKPWPDCKCACDDAARIACAADDTKVWKDFPDCACEPKPKECTNGAVDFGEQCESAVERKAWKCPDKVGTIMDAVTNTNLSCDDNVCKCKCDNADPKIQLAARDCEDAYQLGPWFDWTQCKCPCEPKAYTIERDKCNQKRSPDWKMVGCACVCNGPSCAPGGCPQKVIDDCKLPRVLSPFPECKCACPDGKIWDPVTKQCSCSNFNSNVDLPSEKCDLGGVKNDPLMHQQCDAQNPDPANQTLTACDMGTCLCVFSPQNCKDKKIGEVVNGVKVECHDNMQCDGGKGICQAADCTCAKLPKPCVELPGQICYKDQDCKDKQLGTLCLLNNCTCFDPDGADKPRPGGDLCPANAECGKFPGDNCAEGQCHLVVFNGQIDCRCEKPKDCPGGQCCPDGQCCGCKCDGGNVTCGCPPPPGPVLPGEKPGEGEKKGPVELAASAPQSDCYATVVSYQSDESAEWIKGLNKSVAEATGRSDYDLFVEHEQQIRVVCVTNDASFPGVPKQSLSLSAISGDMLADSSADSIGSYSIHQTSGSLFLDFTSPTQMPYSRVQLINKPVLLAPLAQTTKAAAFAKSLKAIAASGTISADLADALPMTSLITDMPLKETGDTDLIINNKMITVQVFALGASQEMSIGKDGTISKSEVVPNAGGKPAPGSAVVVMTLTMPINCPNFVQFEEGNVCLDQPKLDTKKVVDELAARRSPGQTPDSSIFYGLKAGRNYETFDFLINQNQVAATKPVLAQHALGIQAVDATVGSGTGGCRCQMNSAAPDLNSILPALIAFVLTVGGISAGRVRRRVK